MEGVIIYVCVCQPKPNILKYTKHYGDSEPNNFQAPEEHDYYAHFIFTSKPYYSLLAFFPACLKLGILNHRKQLETT